MARRLSKFLSWIRDLAIWYVLLPIEILHWIQRWRYTALWISSLSLLYFSIITVTYYWNTYPENATAGSIATLAVLLTLWGYYNDKSGY